MGLQSRTRLSMQWLAALCHFMTQQLCVKGPIIIFDRWEHWDSERLSDLSKVIQQIISRNDLPSFSIITLYLAFPSPNLASGPITSWEIDGETVETVSDFIFWGSKITADGDCSHEIKRHLLLGRKVMTNLDSILKSRDITLPTKVRLVKAMVFPVVMYGCESWTVKKAERRRIDAFELWCWRRLLRVPWTARRSNQSILKEISPGCALEEMMLKLKLQYFGHLMRRVDSLEKTLMLGGIGGRRRREDEMAGWHHWLDGRESGWTPGVGDGQGGLACCDSWGRKELDMTERLNWTELNVQSGNYALLVPSCHTVNSFSQTATPFPCSLAPPSPWKLHFPL